MYITLVGIKTKNVKDYISLLKIFQANFPLKCLKKYQDLMSSMVFLFVFWAVYQSRMMIGVRQLHKVFHWDWRLVKQIYFDMHPEETWLALKITVSVKNGPFRQPGQYKKKIQLQIINYPWVWFFQLFMGIFFLTLSLPNKKVA